MKKQNLSKISVMAIALLLFLIMPFATAKAEPVYTGDANTNVWYKAHVQDIGWQADTTNGSTAGTTGQVKNMEAIEIDVQDDASFNIEYTVDVAGKGWTSAVRNGQTAGTVGQNRALTNLCVAIKDKQTNKDSTKYDVYYRAHVRNIGWRGWVKNGYPSGDSVNEIEAVQIQIRLKDSGPIESKFIQPLNGTVTSEYGYRWHPIDGVYRLHSGIDIAAPSGTAIKASAGGKVVVATYDNSYGYYVMIDNGNGVRTLYAHCSKLEVSVGQSVSQGQLIALVGSTGNSTGPHCHFEVRVNGSSTNPRNYVTIR